MVASASSPCLYHHSPSSLIWFRTLARACVWLVWEWDWLFFLTLFLPFFYLNIYFCLIFILVYGFFVVALFEIPSSCFLIFFSSFCSSLIFPISCTPLCFLFLLFYSDNQLLSLPCTFHFLPFSFYHVIRTIVAPNNRTASAKGRARYVGAAPVRERAAGLFEAAEVVERQVGFVAAKVVERGVCSCSAPLACYAS